MTEAMGDGKKLRKTPPVEDLESGSVSSGKVLRMVVQIPLFFASVSVVVMAALVTLEVFLRSAVGISTLISDELSGYLMVLITFMGLTYTFESGRMIQLDFVYKNFSKRTKGRLNFLFYGFAFVYAAILTYEFMGLVLNSRAGGVQSVQTLGMPLYIPQMTMVIGAFFLAVYFLVKLIAEISRWRPERYSVE